MCLPIKPFKVEREWEHAGLKCAVVQARACSFRCAYVRVPPTHRFHGKDSDLVDISVHGGLTFSELEPCVEEDGKGWWFGFDFAHCDDEMNDPNPDLTTLNEEERHYVLKMREIHDRVEGDMKARYPDYKGRHGHFWTQAEAERECEALAEQLAAA